MSHFNYQANNNILFCFNVILNMGNFFFQHEKERKAIFLHPFGKLKMAHFILKNLNTTFNFIIRR